MSGGKQKWYLNDACTLRATELYKVSSIRSGELRSIVDATMATKKWLRGPFSFSRFQGSLRNATEQRRGGGKRPLSGERSFCIVTDRLRADRRGGAMIFEFLLSRSTKGVDVKISKTDKV